MSHYNSISKNILNINNHKHVFHCCLHLLYKLFEPSDALAPIQTALCMWKRSSMFECNVYPSYPSCLGLMYTLPIMCALISQLPPSSHHECSMISCLTSSRSQLTVSTSMIYLINETGSPIPFTLVVAQLPHYVDLV